MSLENPWTKSRATWLRHDHSFSGAGMDKRKRGIQKTPKKVTELRYRDRE